MTALDQLQAIKGAGSPWARLDTQGNAMVNFLSDQPQQENLGPGRLNTS
jgi:hypothetical protein